MPRSIWNENDNKTFLTDTLKKNKTANSKLSLVLCQQCWTDSQERDCLF